MTYPCIFIDTDTWSKTYLQYCIRVSESLSLDGYKTILEAQQAMDKLGETV
jgi:hypothetical protein